MSFTIPPSLKILLQILLIPLIIIGTVLTFSYLMITPSPKKTVQFESMNTIIESMKVLSPDDERLKVISEHVTTITKITDGIKHDKIGCIIPTAEEISQMKNNNVKIIFPDSGAFGGDAVLGPQNIIQQKNPLLEIVKLKEQEISRLVSSIQLDMDMKDSKFKTRFFKKSVMLQEYIDTMKNQVVSQCSRQKIRLRNTYPHLSNYQFLNENVNSPNTSPAKYVYGKNLTPVTRETPMENSSLGLLPEYHPAT